MNRAYCLYVLDFDFSSCLPVDKPFFQFSFSLFPQATLSSPAYPGQVETTFPINAATCKEEAAAFHSDKKKLAAHEVRLNESLKSRGTVIKLLLKVSVLVVNSSL